MKTFSEVCKKRSTPLRMKLFWYIAAFFLFVIMLLWVCQVFFMNDFYRAVTVSYMKRDAKKIENVLKSGENVDSAVYGASMGSGICVSVYEIKDGRGEIVSQAHVKNGCRVHEMMSGDALNIEYSAAKKSGGKKLTEAYGHEYDYNTGYIYYSVVFESGDKEHFIIMDADAYLSDATSSTVTVQLTMITVILIFGAAILAVAMSRKITKPVSELSREAEELAAGDYSVDLPVSGIEELDSLGVTLDYAAKELKRSAELKQELVANITHDLRTPLTMISGYSELMRDIPGEVTAENLQIIIDESARLSSLVNDVLEVSRAQNGQIALNTAEFCITDSVRDSVYRYSEMLRGKGYDITYEYDGEALRTTGDETKLMQAFCNLLNNAINFTGECRKVIVRQYVSEGMLRTEVTDFGDGISADELESIWDRYYRARDRHNKGVPGSGLGLSIVKHIMLLHDISFGVTSAQGKGSTFWFEVKIV